MSKEINFKNALAYEKKHDVAGRLYDAFEYGGGGCAHDLGLTGALAIVREWEKIRSVELVEELMKL